MSTFSTTVLSGDAAFLVATQAELLTNSGTREIYKLRTPDLRFGVYEPESRRLVIFDAVALAALASMEVAEDRPLRKPPLTLLQGADRYADA